MYKRQETDLPQLPDVVDLASALATLDEVNPLRLAGRVTEVTGLVLKATIPGVRDVANIGFGSGLTTHTLLGSPELAHLDTIEIERMMIEGARLYSPLNKRAFSDPRSRIHIEDAKTYFASQARRYDLIVSEPSNPWVSGTATLFSQEFYGQARRYLKPEGLLVQWVQAYEINVGLLSSIFTALGKSFGDYAVYRTGADLLVVATPAARLPRLSDRAFAFPDLARDLERLGVRGLGDLEAMRVGGRTALEPLFLGGGVPPNSDYYPVLDPVSYTHLTLPTNREV